MVTQHTYYGVSFDNMFIKPRIQNYILKDFVKGVIKVHLSLYIFKRFPLKVCIYAHAELRPNMPTYQKPESQCWYSKEPLIKLGVMAIILPWQCSYHDNRLKLYAYYIQYCNQGNPHLRVYKNFHFCLSIALVRSTFVMKFVKRYYVQIVCA